MSFEFDMPEELAKSNFLEEPGTYHCSIIAVDEAPVSKSNMAIDGFNVAFSVLDGTVRNKDGCTEVGKEFDLTFFNGKYSDKDQGRFAKQKQAAFIIAAGLASEADLGKKGLQLNLRDAEQRQVVITVEKDDKNPKFLRLSYCNVFAVDHPKVAAVPKNVKALALIGKASAAPAVPGGVVTPATKATAASKPASATAPVGAPATVGASAGSPSAWNL